MRLLALFARRILWMPPTLIGLLLIAFTISNIIPADPVKLYAKSRSLQNEAFIEAAIVLGASPLRVIVLHVLPSISSGGTWVPGARPATALIRIGASA